MRTNARACSSRAPASASVGLWASAWRCSASRRASPKRCHHGPLGAASSGVPARQGASSFQCRRRRHRRPDVVGPGDAAGEQQRHAGEPAGPPGASQAAERQGRAFAPGRAAPEPAVPAAAASSAAALTATGSPSASESDGLTHEPVARRRCRRRSRSPRRVAAERHRPQLHLARGIDHGDAHAFAAEQQRVGRHDRAPALAASGSATCT